MLLPWIDQGPWCAQGDFHVETLAPGCREYTSRGLVSEIKVVGRLKKNIYIKLLMLLLLAKKISATPEQMNITTPTEELTGNFPTLLAEEQLQCYTYS